MVNEGYPERLCNVVTHTKPQRILEGGFWARSGLQEGDVVLLHSSASRILCRLGLRGNPLGPKVILDSLLHYLGKRGTLLLPLFNFDAFINEQFFSCLSTPSQMGVLSEYARVNYEGTRTGHPVYSFFVMGCRQSDFEGIDNYSAYACDSPFGKLHELGGRIAVLDLDDQNSMTAYHFVEQLCRVDYRYHKDFRGTYENNRGKQSERSYSIFVRDISQGVITDVNRAGSYLWDLGLYLGDLPRTRSGLRSIAMSDFVSVVKQLIDQGRAADFLFSRIPGEPT